LEEEIMKPLPVALVSAFVGLGLGLMVGACWRETATVDQANAPANQALPGGQAWLGEMRSFVGELKSIASELRAISSTSQGSMGAPERRTAEGLPESVAETARALRELTEGLRAAKAQMAPLRQTYEQAGRTTARSMRAAWQTDEEAKAALLFRSYAETLHLLGPPQSVGSGGGLRVHWHYPDGHVRFTDGFVEFVEIMR
jgi:hypothetical protein